MMQGRLSLLWVTRRWASSRAKASGGQFHKLRGKSSRKEKQIPKKPAANQVTGVSSPDVTIDASILYRRVDPFYYHLAVPLAITQATMATVLTLVVIQQRSSSEADDNPAITMEDRNEAAFAQEEGNQAENESSFTIRRIPKEEHAAMTSNRKGSSVSILAAVSGFAAFVLYGSITLTNKRIVLMQWLRDSQKVRLYVYDLFGRKRPRLLKEVNAGELQIKHAHLHHAAQFCNRQIRGQNSVVILSDRNSWYTIDTSSCDYLNVAEIERVTQNKKESGENLAKPKQ